MTFQGLPQCSSDLITNYIEVVSSLSVSEENGVIFCGGITHTAIVTFTEELTGIIFTFFFPYHTEVIFYVDS